MAHNHFANVGNMIKVDMGAHGSARFKSRLHAVGHAGSIPAASTYR